MNNINDKSWRPKLVVEGNKDSHEKGILLTGTTVGMISKTLELEIGVCGKETIDVVEKDLTISYVFR